MFNESIKSPSTFNKMLNPSVNYVGTKARVKFNGDCLKQGKIYTVYEIDRSVDISHYPMLGNCLFGAVKLTKHVDIDLHIYSRYGIGFDRKRFFQLVMKLVEM